MYYIEVDEAGNIMASMFNPTMVACPLVCTVTHQGADGKDRKCPKGKPASHHGIAMLPPIETDQATYELLHGRLEAFQWDGKQVVAR